MPVKTLTESAKATVAVDMASAGTTFTIDHENPRIMVGQTMTNGNEGGGADPAATVTVTEVSGKTITVSANVEFDDGDVITFGDVLSTDPKFSQQQSQKSSRAAAAAGGIHKLKLISGGSGYNNDGASTSLAVTGDGLGCLTPGTILGSYISGGAFVSDIIITGGNATTGSGNDNVGADYSVAQATVTQTGASGAVFEPIISPRGRPGFSTAVAGGGHGSDPVFELGGFYVGINVQISGTTDTQIANTQDFRQISLIRNPLVGGVIPTSPASAINTLKYIGYGAGYTAETTLAQAVQTGDYVIENSLGFKGYIVNVDTTNNRIYYFQNDLTGYVTPTDADMVIKSGGQVQTQYALTASSDAITLNAPELNFNAGSGEMLFLENRDPIQRSTSQIEDVKLIIEF